MWNNVRQLVTVRAGALCPIAVASYVSSTAWPDRRFPQADVAARFYFVIARSADMAQGDTTLSNTTRDVH